MPIAPMTILSNIKNIFRFNKLKKMTCKDHFQYSCEYCDECAYPGIDEYPYCEFQQAMEHIIDLYQDFNITECTKEVAAYYKVNFRYYLAASKLIDPNLFNKLKLSELLI